MERLGADVGALEAAGQQLARFAAQVDEARGRIDRQVAWMPWVGADASAFRARWNRIAVGDLQVLSTDLQNAQLELLRQAEQQRVASDARRGAALSLAAIGGASTRGLTTAAAPSRALAARILGRMTPGPATAAGWVTGAGLARGLLLAHAGSVAAGAAPALVRSVPREVAAAVLGWLTGAVVAGPAGAAVGAVIGHRWASGVSGGSDAADRPTPGSSDAGSVAEAPPADAAREPAPGTVGARSGALSEGDRGSDAMAAAYRRDATQYLAPWLRPDGDSAGHCTAWVNHRVAELDPTYRDVAATIAGNGGEMAANANRTWGGDPEEIPRLGAVLSHGVEGRWAAYGHAAVVEEINVRDDGSLAVRVSEANYGEPFRDDRVLIRRVTDGEVIWTQAPNGDPIHSVEIANLPR